MPESDTIQRVRVVDSHTGGEPTRIVIDGGPDLGSGPLAVRRELFAKEFDSFRSAVVCEPRGYDALVGALLVEPHEPGCSYGAIFFNNVGTLGMCGHATIGLAVTLAHMGRISPGPFRLDTPVGPVTVDYHGGASATVANVSSYRYASRVAVVLDDEERILGDIAWGGNWFFLTHARKDIPLNVSSVGPLTEHANRIRRALASAGITGANGETIDHIELFGPAHNPHNHARNFVLCPGGAYDRSPCGTGTSAKVACLAAEGRLKPGEIWRQESILGSVFECWYDEMHEGRVIPHIRGEAFVTAESTLLFDPADPFRVGVRS